MMRRRRKANDLRSDVSLLITSSCDDHFQTGTVFLGCFFLQQQGHRLTSTCPDLSLQILQISPLLFHLQQENLTRQAKSGDCEAQMSFAKLDNEGRNMFWHSGCKQCWDIFSVEGETVVFQYVCIYLSVCLSLPTKS